MKMVPQKVYAAIKENDLDSVLFSDPFSDNTRKTKRNLLLAAFICILISALELKITGFLGLQTKNQALGSELAQGLVSLVVIYFLFNFILQAFIDFQAWQFQKEKLLTKPYIDLISLLENNYRTINQQISSAMHNFSIPEPFDLHRSHELQEFSKMLGSTSGQINSIKGNLASVLQEMQPLIDAWSETIMKMDRLNARLRARFLSFWSMDIGFPIVMALFAINMGFGGIGPIFTKIMS